MVKNLSSVSTWERTFTLSLACLAISQEQRTIVWLSWGYQCMSYRITSLNYREVTFGWMKHIPEESDNAEKNVAKNMCFFLCRHNQRKNITSFYVSLVYYVKLQITRTPKPGPQSLRVSFSSSVEVSIKYIIWNETTHVRGWVIIPTSTSSSRSFVR